jgi:chemotaxis protein MotB
MASEFKTYLAQEESLSDNISIEVDETAQYVKFTFEGELLFDSGRADLKENSLQALDMFALVAIDYPGHLIRVEGHTDNVPQTGSAYPSNRHLSSARADAVVVYLEEEKGLDSMFLSAEGLGENHPTDTNETPEGRMKNRRVEIKIYAKQEAEADSLGLTGFNLE